MRSAHVKPSNPPIALPLGGLRVEGRGNGKGGWWLVDGTEELVASHSNATRCRGADVAAARHHGWVGGAWRRASRYPMLATGGRCYVLVYGPPQPASAGFRFQPGCLRPGGAD